MIGWSITRRSGFFKLMLAAVLVLSISAIPLPQTSGWWHGQAEAAPPDHTPKGQLKRRGIVGVVLSITEGTATSTPPVATSTLPSIMMILQTPQGDVRIIVPDSLEVHAPRQEGISLMGIIDMKVAVLANKPPVDPNAADGDNGVIRTVTAKKIMIIPSQAYRTHGRGLVIAAAKGKGKFKLLGQDGEEQEVEIADEASLEEGDDIIFIKTKNFDGNATTTPLFISLRGVQKADHIADRLTKITNRLLQATGSPAAEKLLIKLEKIQASVNKRLEKLGQQILRLESKGVQFSPKIHGKFRSNDTDGEDNSGKGRRPHSLTGDADSDGDGDRPNRGKGKPNFAQSSDGDDTDGQRQNRGRSQNQNRHGDAVDCDDFDGADPADIPLECLDEEDDDEDGDSEVTTTSSSGTGSGKADGPGRGKKN